MALWSDSFTKVGKSEYQEAKEKYDETSAKIEKLTKKGKDIYEKVTSMLQSKPVFVGYKAVHNYRAETNDGTAWIGNTVYFFDKEFKQLIYEIELDEYNQTKEFINDLKHRN